MFIFYFLGVRLPCCSIFCQFWLWEEAQCVYLPRHLGSPHRSVLFFKKKTFLKVFLKDIMFVSYLSFEILSSD